jgi:hypothetical protein
MLVEKFAGNILYQPAFSLKAFVESAPPWGIQHSHHGGNDPAFLHELDLPLKYVGATFVESHDEAPRGAYLAILCSDHHGRWY